MKEYLLTPGPTFVPSRIFKAMERPTLHHRTPEFEAIFEQAREGLRKLLDSAEAPLIFACSGTGAMEATLLNTCPPGTEVAYVSAGVFGDRWGKIAKAIGLETSVLKVEAGHAPTPEQVATFMKTRSKASVLCLQACETSTATSLPAAEIAAAVRKVAPECLIVVDAISAMVTESFSMNGSEIDVLIGASQKGFMLPPGLSFIAMNNRAWKRVGATPRRTFYFDFNAERTAQQDSTTAWTPAMSLIIGLNEALALLNEQGMESVYERHRKLGRAARAALTDLGFRLLSESPSPGVTAAFPPDGVDADLFRKNLLKTAHVRIAGGQAALKGKIIRIGHMGHIFKEDLIAAIAGIEQVLTAMTGKPASGGVAAVEAVFA